MNNFRWGVMVEDSKEWGLDLNGPMAVKGIVLGADRDQIKGGESFK